MFDTRYRCLFINSTRWQVDFPNNFEAWWATLDYTLEMIVCVHVHESKCGHELNCTEHVMCGRAKHRLTLLYTRCCYNNQQFVSVNIRRLSKCCWRNGFVSARGSRACFCCCCNSLTKFALVFSTLFGVRMRSLTLTQSLSVSHCPDISHLCERREQWKATKVENMRVCVVRW